MSKRFHIGIRVEEIVSIGPSGDEKFPTAYHLRNGHITNTGGTWRDNVAAVDRILEDLEIAKREDEARDKEIQWEIRQLEETKARLEAENKALKSFTLPPEHADLSEPLRLLHRVAENQLGRPYTTAPERECLRVLLNALTGGDK